MPNEKGIPLLMKALAAKLTGIRRSEYTAMQFVHALMGGWIACRVASGEGRGSITARLRASLPNISRFWHGRSRVAEIASAPEHKHWIVASRKPLAGGLGR